MQNLCVWLFSGRIEEYGFAVGVNRFHKICLCCNSWVLNYELRFRICEEISIIGYRFQCSVIGEMFTSNVRIRIILQSRVFFCVSQFETLDSERRYVQVKRSPLWQRFVLQHTKQKPQLLRLENSSFFSYSDNRCSPEYQLGGNVHRLTVGVSRFFPTSHMQHHITNNPVTSENDTTIFSSFSVKINY